MTTDVQQNNRIRKTVVKISIVRFSPKSRRFLIFYSDPIRKLNRVWRWPRCITGCFTVIENVLFEWKSVKGSCIKIGTSRLLQKKTKGEERERISWICFFLQPSSYFFLSCSERFFFFHSWWKMWLLKNQQFFFFLRVCIYYLFVGCVQWKCVDASFISNRWTWYALSDREWHNLLWPYSSLWKFFIA